MQYAGSYGAAPAPMQLPVPQKTQDLPFAQGQRVRLNLLALGISVGAPWLLFSTVFGALSLDVHYDYPESVYAIEGLGLLAILVCGMTAWSKSQMIKGRDEWQPNWLLFVLFSLCLAWPLAVFLGTENYVNNMEPYLNAKHLSSYKDIDPIMMQGQQLMDAATVVFTDGARVDLAKAMSFKGNNNGVKKYCVAPITGNAQAPTSYDFWAVGVDCCQGSGLRANFHCGASRDLTARGGLRWMMADDKPFFRLAVQQAEATHNITASHPLFFDFRKQDPDETVDSWRTEAMRMLGLGMFAHLMFQGFLVAFAAMMFSKVAAPLT